MCKLRGPLFLSLSLSLLVLTLFLCLSRFSATLRLYMPCPIILSRFQGSTGTSGFSSLHMTCLRGPRGHASGSPPSHRNLTQMEGSSTSKPDRSMKTVFKSQR